MLDNETKKRIDDARDILVGKVPDPKSQVEQITIALIYKFMDDMDLTSEGFGGKPGFFAGDYKRYAWRNLMDPANGGHEMLALYSEAIQRLNTNPGMPQLFRDIFKNAYLPYRDPQTLRDFLKVINGFNYDHSEKLGDAFEYLLSVLGSQGDAGQFRTPRHIIDFMVYITDPKKHETVLDPACGTAGFLISSYKHILRNNSSGFDPANNLPVFGNGDGKQFRGDLLTPAERVTLVKNFRGYDISPDMVRLSLVNLYLHGFAEPRISEYDTLTSDERWNEHSDVILANPPFMSPRGGIRPHSRFSVSSNRSEVLFVDYIAEHLTPGGRAAVIVPEGIIFQSGNAYKALRKMLVEKYLYAVVSLPAGVFNPYSGVKTSILLMDTRLASRTDSILFVKIESDGYDLGAQRRPVDKNDLPIAAKCLKAYTTALLNNTPFEPAEYPNILLAKKEDIASNGDYNLSGERYKAISKPAFSRNFVKIGEYFVTSSGGTPNKSRPEYFDGNIPWIKSGELEKGFIYDSEEKLTDAGLKNSSAKLFPINTVLVAMYGATVGQVGLLKIEATTNQAVCGILPREDVIPEFLFYILKSKRDDLISMSMGGAQPNISQKIIKDIQIPLPPLEVQKEIVTQIDSWQKIIDGARQIIDNYKPHIDIDPSWPTVELGEVCEIVRGSSPRPKADPRFYGGEVPRLMVADITRDGMYTTPSIDFLTLEGAKKSRPMQKGDVIITVSGNPGLPTILNCDACIHDGLVGLKNLDKECILAEFLYYFLLKTKDIQNDASVGAVYRNLTTDQISKILVPLPATKIQLAIIDEMNDERMLVQTNQRTIEVFNKKIRDLLQRLFDA